MAAINKGVNGAQYMIADMPRWQSLKGSAILRKHAGDIDGAIADMLLSISLTRPVPDLSEQTELSLNYLCVELYMAKDALDLAEGAIRDAIAIARRRQSSYLGDHLLVLAGLQYRVGRHQLAQSSAEEARIVYQHENNSHGISRAQEIVQKAKSDGKR